MSCAIASVLFLASSTAAIPEMTKMDAFFSYSANQRHETDTTNQAPANDEIVCLTPLEKITRGLCVDITYCPLLLEFFHNNWANQEIRNFLLRSTQSCGKQNPKNPWIVCCPASRVKPPLSHPDTTTEYIPHGDMYGPPENIPSRENDGFPPNFPSPGKGCGVSDVSHSRIINGVKAKLGGWPWIVVYGFKIEGRRNLSWLCGGTLITDRVTITAAHCTEPEGFAEKIHMKVARMGELNLDPRVDDGAHPVDRAVAKYINHPGFTHATMVNDIAIVILDQPVSFSENIQPICLPFNLRAEAFVKKAPFAAGWGVTQFNGTAASKDLLEIQLNVVSNRKCKKKYAEGGGVITDRHLCATGSTQDGVKDTCQGDSGGPLTLPWKINRKVFYFLIGVVSWGYECGHPDFPGVYTRVTSYLDWITSELQGM